MTIALDVAPEVKAELARQASARGMEMNAYAATVLADAIHAHESMFDEQRARAAASRIRELRDGVSLGGLTIRQLIDEGRR